MICYHTVSFTSYLDEWVSAQRLPTSIPSQLAPESVCRSVKPFQSSAQKAIESAEAVRLLLGLVALLHIELE